MTEQDRIRQMIRFRCSPLLDMALSLLVLENPERFGSAAPWVGRVMQRASPDLLEVLRSVGEKADIFSLALGLEESLAVPVAEMLRRLQESQPLVGAPLAAYWEAISPEVAGQAGLLTHSVQEESARLAQMDPLAFICRFSDRVSVAGDGEAIILHWGKGMRIPLDDLERILFVPSAFSPRRLMFYRVGKVQIFFYTPAPESPAELEELPESLVLGLSALADPTRLKLLRFITTGMMPAQEMAQRLSLNESTVSRHLRLLVEAGIVGRERYEGKYIYYSLQSERIEQLAAQIRGYLGREGSF